MWGNEYGGISFQYMNRWLCRQLGRSPTVALSPDKRLVTLQRVQLLLGKFKRPLRHLPNPAYESDHQHQQSSQGERCGLVRMTVLGFL